MSLELPNEPIAVGRTAEVYAVGDDRVLKLLKPGFDPSMIESEGDKTAAAHAAGVPAPAVHETVEIDGRMGLVLDRVDGDLLLDDIVLDPMRIRQWSKVFASVHAATLTKHTQDLPDIREILDHKIRRSGLPNDQKSAALRVLDAAPDGDAVLHGDFHPGNVIVTKTEPVLIDWIDGARGHAGADIARTLWLISPATMTHDAPNRRIIQAIQGYFRRSYLKQVSRAVGVDRRVIDAWRLPIVAARLAEGVENEEEALHDEVTKLTGG